jgi:hypothetical protein
LSVDRKRKYKIAERHNTSAFIFDPTSPRITAFDIHDRIHDFLRIPEHSVNMIKMKGRKRRVYSNLSEKACIQALLRDTNSQPEYKHQAGKLLLVSIAVTGMSTKRVLIANLASNTLHQSSQSAPSKVLR